MASHQSYEDDEEEFDLAPLPDIWSIKRPKKGTALKSTSSFPSILSSSSDAQTPFLYTGSVLSTTVEEGVDFLCREAKSAAHLQNIRFTPSLAIVFFTQQYKLNENDNICKRVIKSNFEEDMAIQIFSSQLNGAFERTPGKTISDRNSFRSEDAAEKTGKIFICLAQQAGLYHRACFSSGSQDVENVIPKKQKGQLSLVSENGVTFVICHRDGNPASMSTVTGGDLLGISGPYPTPKGDGSSEAVSSIAKLIGGTQDVLSTSGTFGLQLQGDRRIRFSLLVGNKEDKEDGVGFRRKVAEMKRLMHEADETDGKGEPVLLMGLVCIARSGLGMPVPNDTAIMTEEFPAIPVFGGYGIGEVVPPRVIPSGEICMVEYHSTWVMISLLSEAEASKRKTFRNLIVPPDFGYGISPEKY